MKKAKYQSCKEHKGTKGSLKCAECISKARSFNETIARALNPPPPSCDACGELHELDEFGHSAPTCDCRTCYRCGNSFLPVTIDAEDDDLGHLHPLEDTCAGCWEILKNN